MISVTVSIMNEREDAWNILIGFKQYRLDSNTDRITWLLEDGLYTRDHV